MYNSVAFWDGVQVLGSDIVWSSVRNNCHRQDKRSDVDPDGEIGDPAKLLKRSYLAQNEAAAYPDDATHNETDVRIHLIETYALR